MSHTPRAIGLPSLVATALGLGMGMMAACGPVVPFDDGSTTGMEGTASTSSAHETTGSMPPNPTGPNPGTTSSSSVDDGTTLGDTDGATEGGCNFLCSPDGGRTLECDQFLEDCPRGEKCMPWANDGGSSWNATKCAPIAGDPDQPGEPCVVEGSGVSGIDSCDIHSMCWDVDPNTLEGTCVPFCEGSPDNPTCADACRTCSLSGDGVLILCLPECDPMAQDCGAESGCYLVNDQFVCAPDASGDQGAVGDPCEYINVCDPGMLCAGAKYVPDCAGQVGCCTPFCEVANPTACDAVPGTVCEPLDVAEPGCAGAGVGVCVVP